MPNSVQWFLDTQCWGEFGEVQVFTDYREARRRYTDLAAQIAEDGSGQDILAVELSDESGYRVAGAGVDGSHIVDDLVDARLGGRPFVVGRYRIQWLADGSFIRIGEEDLWAKHPS